MTVQGGLNSSIFVWIAGGPPAQLGPILGAMLGYVDNAWRPARAPSVLGMDLWDVSHATGFIEMGNLGEFQGPLKSMEIQEHEYTFTKDFG